MPGEAAPTATRLPPARRPPSLIAGGPETSRCFSEWLVIQSVGKMG